MEPGSLSCWMAGSWTIKIAATLIGGGFTINQIQVLYSFVHNDMEIIIEGTALTPAILQIASEAKLDKKAKA